MFGQLTIFVLLALTSTARSQYKLSVEVVQKSSTDGDEAIVTCKVLAMKTNSKMDVVWVQKLEGEKDVKGSVGEDKEYEIGRNDKLYAEFTGWKKYEVEKNKVDSKNTQRIYQLKVLDLKTTDSGQIGCRLEKSHVSVFKPLVIIAKPQGIQLKSSNLERSEASVYHDNEKVSFHEGNKRNFACVVNKTHPIPEISIMLGDKDISDKFEKKVKLTRKMSSNQSRSFVSELFYDVALSAESFEISHEFDNKKLLCIVKHTDDHNLGNSYEQQTSIRINLHGYKPKFLCEGGELEKSNGQQIHYYQAKLHHKLFPIKCRVIGVPPVESVIGEWKKNGGRQVEIGSGQKRGNHFLSVEDDEEDENAKKMTFQISRLFPQHFRTYTFVASNDLGETRYLIQLTRFGANMEALTGSSNVFFKTATTQITLICTMLARLCFQ